MTTEQAIAKVERTVDAIFSDLRRKFITAAIVSDADDDTLELELLPEFDAAATESRALAMTQIRAAVIKASLEPW